MRIRHLRVHNFRGIKSLSYAAASNFNCIVGAGDSCKTTILSALDYALSPRTSLAFDDSDFFNQDVNNEIVIQVTLSDWDESLPHIRGLFQESKFAQFKCGLTPAGPVPEPTSAGAVAFSVSLRVDKGLEPKWFAVKGLDNGEESVRKPIYASERALLGLSRLDLFSDVHFTWGRNTILTRLSEGENLSAVLSDLSREMRHLDISGYASIEQCKSVADAVRVEARSAGVNLGELSPKVDIQRQSMSAGVISLHEGNVPLRNKGSGSKRLVGTAMQMKLHGGKSIAVIDEIEIGLEPHRVRGLLHRLRNSRQQIFATTHSPVVLRELDVESGELFVCKRDALGHVSIECLNTVPNIQGSVRANAEAFLGSKIVACEGPTEIGCLRAYDLCRLDANDAPVWSLATAYLNCSGAGNIKSIAPKLAGLGYQTAVLCDNDAPDQLSASDVAALSRGGILVAQWDEGNSIEQQLFAELPWENVPAVLIEIGRNHDSLTYTVIVDSIIKNSRVAEFNLSAIPESWPESVELRGVIGALAHERGWIKRIDYAQKAFQFALPLLSEGGTIKSRLASLWRWIQQHE